MNLSWNYPAILIVIIRLIQAKKHQRKLPHSDGLGPKINSDVSSTGNKSEMFATIVRNSVKSQLSKRYLDSDSWHPNNSTYLVVLDVMDVHLSPKKYKSWALNGFEPSPYPHSWLLNGYFIIGFPSNDHIFCMNISRFEGHTRIPLYYHYFILFYYKTCAIDYGALDLDYGSSTCGFMDLFLYINQPKSTLPLKGFDVNTGSLLRLLRYDHADN